MIEDKERGITIVAATPLAYSCASAIKAQMPNIEIAKKDKTNEAKLLLSYCAVNGYMPYLGSSRKRDLLSQEEQLRRIALAEQKRERKALMNKK